MIKKNINKEKLLDCVNHFEHECRKSEFKSHTSENHIYRYSAPRKDKIVIIMPSGLFDSMQETLLRKAEQMILADGSLSDHIDVYSTGIIPEKRATELERTLREQGLSVTFFDGMEMEQDERFAEITEHKAVEIGQSEIDPSFFDYLALSNDSTDIKSSFFYSLLLMEIYRVQPLTEKDFYELCCVKYGQTEQELKLALKQLRKREKITSLKKGGLFTLTDEEQRAIEKAIKDSKKEEESFVVSLEQLLSKYRLDNMPVLIEWLKHEYLEKYNLIANPDDEITDKRNTDQGGMLDGYLSGLNNTDREKFMTDLRSLCQENDYLDQYGLIHSFLDLFRSKKYEGYLENKTQYIYMDTPIIEHFICMKSSFISESDIEWGDPDFNNASDLFNIFDESNSRIKLIAPHDYIQETVGELKKALQISWFSHLEDLPIPVETANTFYNFYLEVKKEEENSIEFRFEDFAKGLGFEELNTESQSFFTKNTSRLIFILSNLGCITLKKIDVHYQEYEELKTDYVWYLHDKNKDKTDLAINADVRQALYITDETINSLDNKECFLVSWDNTLYHLRNKARELKESEMRSFSIFKPGDLAERLAFRNLKFRKENVSNEVFAYANKSYNVRDKIRSLYDNVLSPYFASIGKSNTAFVLSILQLQKANMETDQLSEQSTKTALENIFTSIIIELNKNNCSSQNLKDYLNNEDHNKIIIPLFNRAFEEYKNNKTITIDKELCKLIKECFRKEDHEIQL